MRILAAAVATLLLAGPVWAQSRTRGVSPLPHAGKPLGPALAPGDPAPSLRARGLDGRVVNYDWSAQKATLVNFWATWCEPCREELPALQKLWTERAKDGLAVVGVTTDPTKEYEAVSAFVKTSGVFYPVVWTSLEVERVWGGVSVLPLTFLVGQNGRIVRRYVGSGPAIVAGLRADVDAFLGGKPLPTQILPDDLEQQSTPRLRPNTDDPSRAP